MDSSPAAVTVALRALFTALLYLFLWRLFGALRRDLELVASGGQAVLTVLEGPADPAPGAPLPGATLTVRNAATLGRGPGNAIMLQDPLVSQAHARLVHRQDGWWLEDLGSTNGTFVNGKAIAGLTRLSSGDIIGCGPQVKLKLHAE